MLHILSYLLINNRYIDQKNRLKELSDVLDELRMLPVPYGLLAHELIEIIDNERLMPGLSWVGKFAEDFPFVDYHSTGKEKT